MYFFSFLVLFLAAERIAQPMYFKGFLIWMASDFFPPKTGYWKATGRILGKFLWKIRYKNLEIIGGGMISKILEIIHPPPMISRFLSRIFHRNFPRKCPVAFQWPARLSSAPQPCHRITSKSTNPLRKTWISLRSMQWGFYYMGFLIHIHIYIYI